MSESEDGLPFFSMKYATGGSLRAAAPALLSQPNECVRLLAKVARAIEYAHGRGVLHRDLQPGNILLDGNGEPLVSDFGLAKWLDENSGHRLWCANALSVIHQASVTPAPRLRAFASSLDRDLETIVARCLEREPQARYPSAGALAEDLDRWLEGRPILARRTLPPARVWRWSRRNPILAGAATTSLLLAGLAALFFLQRGAPTAQSTGINSLAVLPLENLSGDASQNYFADGMTEALITDLAKVGALRVIARAAVIQYKGARKPLREVGRELNVDAVLTGSVR